MFHFIVFYVSEKDLVFDLIILTKNMFSKSYGLKLNKGS